MLCVSLMHTLGLLRKKLGMLLKHLTYDGVYASSQERVRGGGSLNLVKHVEVFLNFPSGSISGSWDSGHKIQLVLGDVLLKDRAYIADVRKMYKTMADFKDGKAGMLFKETADDLQHPVLTNKSTPQNTRWARSDMRAIETFYRNAPTFSSMYGKNAVDFASEGDLTSQKDCERCMKQLADGHMWAVRTGVSQILEVITECSLKAQYNTHHATSVLLATNKAIADLERLGQNWVWNDTPLKFVTSVGAPSQFIQNLKQGYFKPHVSQKVMQKKVACSNIEHQYYQ